MSVKVNSNKVSDEYQKCYMVVDDGKTIEVFYNPNEKDPLKAYQKRVVN